MAGRRVGHHGGRGTRRLRFLGRRQRGRVESFGTFKICGRRVHVLTKW
ncbi:hypothetical protein PV726_43865 [Streptomyces europaeiscabiei]|nr:hypothetical protein [Streptomyces europaeiscabiei]MDX3697056.1 hypothetical protein [Streptomyces europaeiscabiei]